MPSGTSVRTIPSRIVMSLWAHAACAGNSGGKAGEIGLHGSGDQQCVRTLRTCGTKVIFKLSGFVSAQRRPGKIISLYEDGNTEPFRYSRRGLKRCRSFHDNVTRLHECPQNLCQLKANRPARP